MMYFSVKFKHAMYMLYLSLPIHQAGCASWRRLDDGQGTMTLESLESSIVPVTLGSVSQFFKMGTGESDSRV